MQDVTTGMREKVINNMECVEREELKRKRKLWAQKYVKTLILSIFNNNNNNNNINDNNNNNINNYYYY